MDVMVVLDLHGLAESLERSAKELERIFAAIAAAAMTVAEEPSGDRPEAEEPSGDRPEAEDTGRHCRAKILASQVDSLRPQQLPSTYG